MLDRNKMPKTKITGSYNPESLEKALDESRNGGKIREIARKYGIPKSTLHFKLKHPDHKSTFGPSPYLTNREETCLENWVLQLSKKGFPLKKEDLQSSVARFLSDHPRPNPFKDNYPGEGWVRGFLKRHPKIVQRTGEGVKFSSACVSEIDIRKWFAEIHQYFAENDLLDVLDDPKRVFNGDESGFQLCPKTGKVLAIKGMKNVYTVETSSSKDNITVMFTFSAAGQCCPPMVVYNYQRIPQKVVDGIPSDWGVGRSENRWMTSELFFEFIANVFHPYLLKENIPLPVIYFLDGNKTHLSYEVSKLCTELQIELIALYPNATHILQPADVAVFRPVKVAWKASTKEWLSQNPGQVITKVNFAEVLNAALQKSIKAKTLINGFKACGLVPFNPNAVDYTKCIVSSKQADPDVDVHHAPHNDDTITFSQFMCLIGPNKAAELQNIGEVNINQIDDNLRILHNIYNSFVTSKTNALTTTLTDHQPTSDSPKSHAKSLTSPITIITDDILLSKPPGTAFEKQTTPGTISPPDITLSPTILQNYGDFNDMFFTQNDDAYTGFTPIPLGQTETQTRLKSSIQDVSLRKRPDSNSSYDLCPITGIFTRNRSTSSPTVFEISELEKTPMKPSNIITPQQRNDTLQPLRPLSEISPAFKVRNSDLGSYLTLPKTPERKGKREIKRMPYAITSLKYRAMYKEQLEKKESDLREKEERKKIREKNKEEKKKKEEEKKKSKEKIKEKSKPTRKNYTSACNVCSKTTKTNNRVVCDMCSLIFHVKCVPLKHQIHVPEDIGIDLFVCHTCYKEEDNDEDEENITNDDQINNNDDSMTSIEESQDTNDIYDQYLSAKKAFLL